MAFTISFAGAGQYTPFEGGTDLFPFEGLTYGTVAKIDETTSEKSGNAMLVFNLVCDEPEAKGMKVKKWVVVSGMRKDGKPNVLGLLDAIASYYSDTMSSDEAVAKARGLEGQNLSSEQIVQSLTGKKIFFEVRARAFTRDDGTTGWGTEVANFNLKQKYVDAKNLNTHHRNLPTEATQRSAAPAPAGNGAAAPNGAATIAPAAPTGGALGIL